MDETGMMPGGAAVGGLALAPRVYLQPKTLSEVLHLLGQNAVRSAADFAGAPGDIHYLLGRMLNSAGEAAGFPRVPALDQETGRWAPTAPTSRELLNLFERYVAPGFLPRRDIDRPLLPTDRPIGDPYRPTKMPYVGLPLD